jgi:mercuric reductase
MTMRHRFDLVILGSGSTAFAAAIRAAELGKTAAMTEARTLGGTCVNRGCLPSKNLIEAARIYWEAQHPRYPGLAPAGMRLDFGALVAQKDAVIEDYRGKKYASIVTDSEQIKVFSGRATFTDAHTVSVDGMVLEGGAFLVATGSRPAIPPIDGLSDVPYLTSDLLTSGEDEEMTERPESLVILGGGYVALELGQMFQRLGTRVTILQRSARILPGYEPEIGETLAAILRDEGVDLVTGAAVQRARRDGSEVAVLAGVGDGAREFRAARLLVATGRAPNSDRLGLEKPGVRLDAHGFVEVDDTLRTTASHVWAAGDVIGRQTQSQPATPVGAHDGVIAASNALAGEGRRVDHRVIPRTIFTDPQVAVVGMTDAEARAAGRRCRCTAVPMSAVPRAGAVRDPRGIIKMVLDADTEEVLGVSMLGLNAGEVIHEAAMALRFRATVHDFIDLVHVYPTMAEALKIVALSFFKDVSRLSCCAE